MRDTYDVHLSSAWYLLVYCHDWIFDIEMHPMCSLQRHHRLEMYLYTCAKSVHMSALSSDLHGAGFEVGQDGLRLWIFVNDLLYHLFKLSFLLPYDFDCMCSWRDTSAKEPCTLLIYEVDIDPSACRKVSNLSIEEYMLFMILVAALPWSSDDCFITAWVFKNASNLSQPWIVPWWYSTRTDHIHALVDLNIIYLCNHNTNSLSDLCPKLVDLT